MKKIFSALLALFAGYASAGNAPLKVLLIGNSFAWSCRTYLREAAASANCALDLEIASIGGCSLERHMAEYAKSSQDADYRPYWNIAQKSDSLPALLAKKKWDVISIQQASHFSWRADSYQPWADQLIAVIRATNPQAEIVIQETWSYNGGDPRFFALNDDWRVDQTSMFEELDKNYRKLAKENNFRIVPVGVAIQLSRREKPKQLPCCDAQFLAGIHDPAALPETTDVVGQCEWEKNADDAMGAHADTIHLNDYGKYLQACVWVGFLFHKPVSEIAFYPAMLDRARLEKLRACARQALDQEKTK